MKKLFRMALVLVLAGSALLYTSCTKDYSPDIKSLQEQINNLNNGPEGLAWLKTQLQGVQSSLSSLEGKVNGEISDKIANLQTQLTNAIADIDAKKADKAAFNALKTAFDELKDELMGEDGKIAEIEAAIEALQNGSDAIANQFSEYAKFIQSMAYVPATSNGLITVVPYYLTDTEDDSYEVENWVYLGNIHGWGRMNPDNWELVTTVIPRNADGTVSQSLLVASFKVTPSDAVSRVTKETASLVAVQTKAAAAAPDTLTITKLVARADAPGYVDVYAIPGKVKFDPNSFAVALAVTQVVGEGENPLEESVTSDYAPATIQNQAENIVFEIRDNKKGDIVSPTRDDDPVEVTPSSDPDSVNVFTAGRWSVVASFAGSYLTPEEAKEVFGLKKIELVSPKVGDTLVVEVAADDAYYDWKNLGFKSTVWPDRATEKKIKDLINDDNGAHSKFQLALNIKNSHMVGETFTPSGKVIGTYQASPDVVKLALTPEHPVVIPWDYKNPNYKDIADTLIAKIWVAGDRNKLIGNGDNPLGKATKTWNKDTEIDYTQAPAGDVTPHTNDTKAIDVVLKSAAQYGKADSTYVYSIQQYEASTATMYVGEFDYVVSKRPADVTVELGPVDTVVRFAGPITFKVDAIYKAIKAHAEAYAPFDTALVYPDFAARLSKKTPKVELDGKKIDQSATFTVQYDGTAKKDASTLTTAINKVGQYKITIETTFDNIKYTYVLTVNAANNPAKIAPKAAYVTVDNAETKDYSVEVKGDVDTTAGAPNRYHYFIKDMPFSDYLKVIDYAEDSEELKVDLITLTKMVHGNTVWAPYRPTDLVRLTEDKTVANLKGDDAGSTSHMNFKWDSYDSLQFAVAAVLFPTAKTDAVVDSATVRLWTANPIPVFDGGDMVVVDHFADGLASANVAAALNIKDLYGVALNDSTGLRAIGWDAKAKEVVVNYDQALTYGNIKDFKVISGAQYIEELDLFWGPTGVINLRINQGTIVNDIIIQIPVKLKHMLSRGLDQTAWVTVKFTEKKVSE